MVRNTSRQMSVLQEREKKKNFNFVVNENRVQKLRQRRDIFRSKTSKEIKSKRCKLSEILNIYSYLKHEQELLVLNPKIL